jgi:hypothetical protein
VASSRLLMMLEKRQDAASTFHKKGCSLKQEAAV